MNAELSTEGKGPPDLSEALDWHTGRTWLVFGGFALFLGILSGAIIVGSETISMLVVRGGRINIVALGISLAAHLGVLSLLSRAIPLRDGAGVVVQGHRILGNPPQDVLPCFWKYLAWVLALTLVASLVILQQPFFPLTSSVALQAAIPAIFALFTAQFPASVLVAKS